MPSQKRILLLADIGNTAIKFSLADTEKIFHSFSLPTRSQYSIDSLGIYLTQMLSIAQVTQIHHAALCSVVPELSSIFRDACFRYLKVKPAIFPTDFSISIHNAYKNPDEVGADRLMAAYAARMLYPDMASIIAVDYGTATTFDCIAHNDYLGGLICPGVLSSHNALAQGTAKLPHISLELEDDSPLIGQNTITSMSHGFIFGFVAMTEGLCERLKEQLPSPVCVIATGGFARDIARISTSIEHVHPDLILEGLRLASQPLITS